MRRILPIGLLLAGLGFVLAGLLVGSSSMEMVMAEGDDREIDRTSTIRLERFEMPTYASGKPRQYLSTVRITDEQARCVSESVISVNHPLRFRDWWIYQFSWGHDETGALCTVLKFVRDRGMWLAAIGGLLLIVAAVGFCLLPSNLQPTTSNLQPSLSNLQPVLAGIATVAIPMFVIIRAMLRPEPVPALQSWLMFPHVGAYAASYLILLFAVFGIGRRFIPLGFLLMTIGLVTGAVWGKFAWSEWWQFDPKENWSFFTWLALAAHLSVRPNSAIAKWLLYLCGVLIIITFFVVNYSRMFSGLHSYV